MLINFITQFCLFLYFLCEEVRAFFLLLDCFTSITTNASVAIFLSTIKFGFVIICLYRIIWYCYITDSVFLFQIRFHNHALIIPNEMFLVCRLKNPYRFLFLYIFLFLGFLLIFDPVDISVTGYCNHALILLIYSLSFCIVPSKQSSI